MKYENGWGQLFYWCPLQFYMYVKAWEIATQFYNTHIGLVHIRMSLSIGNVPPKTFPITKLFVLY